MVVHLRRLCHRIDRRLLRWLLEYVHVVFDFHRSVSGGN